MKQQLSATKIVLALALTALTIGITAFRQKGEAQTTPFRTQQGIDDTTRKRSRPAPDRNLEEMDKAMQKLDIEMRKLDIQMRKLDTMNFERFVNVERVNKEVEEALKKVDWKKIDSDIKEAMVKLKEVDMQKLRAELSEARAEISKERHQVHIDREKIRADVEKSVMAAREHASKAREEVQYLQDFTDALEKDGLIDKTKSYKIEVKNGELYLNDVKQSKEVSDKYRQYYKKDNFQINISHGPSKGAVVI